MQVAGAPQPPLHPWTAAALPGGMLPTHLQPDQPQQAAAGPNAAQQPFDIVAYAGAAADEAEAAAAALGAAAERSDAAVQRARAHLAAGGMSPASRLNVKCEHVS